MTDNKNDEKAAKAELAAAAERGGSTSQGSQADDSKTREGKPAERPQRSGRRDDGGSGRGNGSRSRNPSSRDDRASNSKNVHSLLTEFLLDRAQRANPHLRSCLTGKIAISFTDAKPTYLFDWSGEQPIIEEVEGGSGDCSITLSEENLLRISNGELNPQVAMLSDKIKVEGKAALAIYLFNLLGARHILG